MPPTWVAICRVIQSNEVLQLAVSTTDDNRSEKRRLRMIAFQCVIICITILREGWLVCVLVNIAYC